MHQPVILHWFSTLALGAADAPPLDPAAPWPVQTWHWLAFSAFVAVMLVLDLTVFHRKSHEPSLRESAVWTVIWSAIALGFNAIIWNWLGAQAGQEFLTGYLVEWSLSMDNVFIFAVVFNFFKVPLQYQYRVLFWGIMGAIVMRLAFVLAGATLLTYAEWSMWIFGVFLIYTGVKLATHSAEDVHPENNFLMRIGKRVLRIAKQDHGGAFTARENGKLCFTPLFLVLLVIEGTDLLFAIDSVPAIYGVTKHPFIVFTSNIFAILGLRALYFLLAGVMDLFRFLNYGLAAILVFVGAKMVAEYWWPRYQQWSTGVAMDTSHHLVPSWLSLVVVLSLLAIAVLASLLIRPPKRPLQETQDPTAH